MTNEEYYELQRDYARDEDPDYPELRSETVVDNKKVKHRPVDENRKDVERLIRLCVELDMEMDGVRVPAAAAAILNAIRGILSKHR